MQPFFTSTGWTFFEKKENPGVGSATTSGPCAFAQLVSAA